jgi:hypothetical protein
MEKDEFIENMQKLKDEYKKQIDKKAEELDFQTKLIEIKSNLEGDCFGKLIRKNYLLTMEIRDSMKIAEEDNEKGEQLLSILDQFIYILKDFKEENK